MKEIAIKTEIIRLGQLLKVAGLVGTRRRGEAADQGGRGESQR